MDSNPAATRNKNGHWDGPLHRSCPNSPAGSQWKTGDVKSRTRPVERKKKKKKKLPLLITIDIRQGCFTHVIYCRKLPEVHIFMGGR